jgi:NADPH:quinone reductase-like Zn-dependent oxidoreductase
MRACGLARSGAAVELIEIDNPPAPGPGEVLVGVQAAGVGAWDRFLPTGGWDVGLHPPAALGVEGAGVVISVGAAVAGVAIGDVVMAHAAPLPGGSGFWAEQVLLTASQVAHCPDRLSPVLAAGLPVSGLTAQQALRSLALSAGQRLLVTGGSGATGGLVVQLAAAAGIAVTATGSAHSAERMHRLGATETADYHDLNWPALLEGRFDAACVAAPGTGPQAIGLIADGGRLCALTSDAPAQERGITCTNLYVEPDAVGLATLAELVLAQRLVVDIDAHPFTDAVEVFHEVAGGRGGGRKFVLEF